MYGPYEHIACCVEPSPAIDLVLGEARRLRDLGEGRLSLVHVVEPPEGYADVPGLGGMADVAADAVMREWIAAQAERMPGSEPVLLDGHPADAVCTWAADEGVDLIIASAHRGLRERIELGSFAGDLIYNSPATLHLVRPAAAGAGG